jgi:hypothetical protein
MSHNNGDADFPPEAQSKEWTYFELLHEGSRMLAGIQHGNPPSFWISWACFWRTICLQQAQTIAVQKLEACAKRAPHSIAQVRAFGSVKTTSPELSLSAILGVAVEPAKPEILSEPSLSQIVSVSVEPAGPTLTSELLLSPVLAVSIEPVQPVQPAESDEDSDTRPKYQDAFLYQKALADYLHSNKMVPVRLVLRVAEKVAQRLARSRMLRRIQQIREKLRQIRFRKPWSFEPTPQNETDGQACLVPCQPTADLTDAATACVAT